MKRGDKKRLALVTTARSDYSTMMPVIKQALNDSDIEASVFCGGMHLLDRFGNTWRQLEKDGIKIDEKIEMFSGDDSNVGYLNAMSLGVKNFGEALLRQKADMLVVSGDRIENIALFTAATTLGLPICHLCGGDITEGALDDQIRHMMTKLSHLHMVSMEEHQQRVLQMGEEPWRVSISGDAAIDSIVNFNAWDRQKLDDIEGVPRVGELVLCTFHPVTLGDENFYDQFENLLNFLGARSEIPVFTFPNIDPGYEKIIDLLENFTRRNPKVILKKSFTPFGYYSMLGHTKFMIGNSSSGIWEAPSFKLPAINVGSRQDGRLRACNVIDTKGMSVTDYTNAIVKMESPKFQEDMKYCINPYGSGNASQKIIEKIKATNFDSKLMLKKFVQYRH